MAEEHPSSGDVHKGAANNSTTRSASIDSKTSQVKIGNKPVYVSYSGVDIKAIIHIPSNYINDISENTAVEAASTDTTKTPGMFGVPGPNIYEDTKKYHSKPVVLADIQTLSYSIYREKYPVRALGYGYPRSFTRGPRTISGSLIFTVFNQHVLYEVMDRINQDTSRDTSTALIDQLPRFDITITFANEFGSASSMAIHGVELYSEGATMSIEDLLTENVVQYNAQDLTPMTRDADRLQHLGFPKDKTADDLLREEKNNTKIKITGKHDFYNA